MNQDTIISVKNVSKKFCKNLKRSMAYGIIDLSKNLFGMKSNTTELRKDEFWALKNINFELKRGETLGMIGINGSGKSTLLRIITGIFPPDTGEVYCCGRVGSLIAIGAGFHPHMTGRENIFLNGIILGMTHKEIKAKFNSIVNFSEINEFLESPISAYSSGMKVRLGFAIAIHCEPDILLVDEVLSVGDIRFQKKCFNKFQEIRKNTSIILVSHSLRQIARICDRSMLLDNGEIRKIGSSSDVVAEYINKTIVEPQKQDNLTILYKTEEIDNIDIQLIDLTDQKTNEIYSDEKCKIRIEFDSTNQISDARCSISFFSSESILVVFTNTENFPFNIKNGKNRLECTIDKIRLIPNAYFLKIKLSPKIGPLLAELDTNYFKIKERPGILKPLLGIYRENCNWSITHENRVS